MARAKNLLDCAKAGADAAKFQHFKADTIVSNYGFKTKYKKLINQNGRKMFMKFIKKLALILNGQKNLKKHKKFKIDFFTSPYDLNYVDKLNKDVCAFKIGSGDIT